MFDLKKAVLIKVIGVLLAIIAISAGAAYAGSVVSRNNLISQDAAENFTIVDAGVSRDDVSSLHSYLERNQGKYVYDVEFHVGDIEYEYEVLAQDGSILEKCVYNEAANNGSVSNIVSNTVDSSSTEENAKGKAEAHSVPLESSSGAVERPGKDSSDKTVSSYSEQSSEHSSEQGGAESAVNKPDQTDSLQQADASVTNHQEKDTVFGELLKKKTAAGDYIGVERAKQIALDDAGFSENEVIFSTAKFDKDDDDDDEAPEYEIEFFKDNVEYEYDIDALTGKILDFSSEIDD
ncbi:MAG: PepSY domain-containing protein [Lachnospiraceae bacterium]|nr:PepSY domain-containing protein [Lachnospiraceae bacterium]